MHPDDMDHREWPLREDEIEAAAGICGAAIDDPQTDPGVWSEPLPSDAQEWAAPPPGAR